MSLSLLIDLGASRLKAGLYEPGSNHVLGTRDVPAPSISRGPRGEMEIAQDAHGKLVSELVAPLLAYAGNSVSNAYLCSEMHGFALLGEGAGPYVSWRDERAAATEVDDSLRDQFRTITGMKLRAGLPFLTLRHLAAQGKLPKRATLVSLPELLISQLGHLEGTIDESMAAALGLYDLSARRWSEVLMTELGPAAAEIKFLEPISVGKGPLGTLKFGGREIPVQAAIGDLQAAVLGSGSHPVSGICVNVGTGSQVNRVGYRPASLKVEERPFVDGTRMATLSHIPAGRALQVLESLFNELAVTEKGTFWKVAAELTDQQVAQSPLTVDLNCFAGSWKYSRGGAISGIHEGNLTARNIVAAAIRAMVDQYLEAISLISPEGDVETLVLAGGVPRRIPALRSLLANLSGLQLTLNDTDEETLAGLQRLAARDSA